MWEIPFVRVGGGAKCFFFFPCIGPFLMGISRCSCIFFLRKVGKKQVPSVAIGLMGYLEGCVYEGVV